MEWWMADGLRARVVPVEGSVVLTAADLASCEAARGWAWKLRARAEAEYARANGWYGSHTVSVMVARDDRYVPAMVAFGRSAQGWRLVGEAALEVLRLACGGGHLGLGERRAVLEAVGRLERAVPGAVLVAAVVS